MVERRKKVPWDELQNFRFPQTENRKRFKANNWFYGRLITLKRGVEDNGAEVVKLDTPTGFDEERQKLITEEFERIKRLYPELASSASNILDVIKEEQERLKGTLISEIQLTKGERAVVVNWSDKHSVSLDLLLGKHGFVGPDPHRDAESSFIYQSNVHSALTDFVSNLVRADRHMWGDPDFQLVSLSVGYATDNDFERKRFALTISLSRDFFAFIQASTGKDIFDQMTVEEPKLEEDGFLKELMEFLYKNSLAFDKEMPEVFDVYRSEFK